MIRKISIGPDLLNAMHFVVGQDVLKGTHKIDSIVYTDSGYKIWIKNDSNEFVLWKSVNMNVPVTIEYDLSF